ncbi:DUF4136 domain-containing protein [Methyloprofundus sp.]|uniref:DUF4136 domain-containing protein n=1 Tax=Methyloprofundus sp. TaxID=2020875 RepID=UPI003D0C0861
MKHSLLALFLAFLLTGCSSLSLSTDYDKSIDFSKFKTYRWHVDNEHNTASLKYLDHIMDKRIRSIVDQQLGAKHYAKKSEGPVDFLVNYSVVIEDRVDVRTYNNYNGMYPGYSYRAGYGYYGRAVGVGYSTGSDTQVTHYKQGTLIIDIINPATDQLIWRGAADGRLPKGSDREKSDKLVEKYVTKILSNFPPKQ